MPTLLEIINKNVQLKDRAQANCYAIERFYSDGCADPMNISTQSKGFSEKPGGWPCQFNGYLLAKCYRDFDILVDVESSKLEEIINFLARPFVMFTKQLDTMRDIKVHPLWDPFVEPIADFLEEVRAFKIMIDTYKQTQHSDHSIAIDFNGIFNTQIEYMIKSHKFDPMHVSAACQQRLANETLDESEELEDSSDSENSDNFDHSANPEEITDEENSLNLSQILMFTRKFERAFQFAPMKLSAEGLVLMNDTDQGKIEALSGYLKVLPASLVRAFDTVFARYHFEKALAESSSSSSNPHYLFSRAQSEHREKFEAVLTGIVTPRARN
jgi:hypothetical protein